MRIPLEISFHGLDRSEAIEALIRKDVEKLEKICDHMVSCRIGLRRDQKRHNTANPFRIRIDTGGCTSCMACARVCRYSALTLKDIRSGRPALTCTLCGDCITGCPHKTIHYHFPGLTAETARKVFIVLVISLHAIFLGVARI